MHNTASVEGHEFHEFWSSFRCARMGTCRLCEERKTDASLEWSGIAVSYDGSYRHERKMEVSDAGFKCVDKVLDADGTVRWRLDKGLAYKNISEDRWRIESEDGKEIFGEISVEGGKAQVVDGVQYPAYGVQVKVEVLEVAAKEGKKIVTRFKETLGIGKN